MNARERVIRTLHHENADRAPIDLGGAASSLTDEAYFNLKAYLGIVGDISPFRAHSSSTYYDERILDRLCIDFRRILLPPKAGAEIQTDDTHFINMWGTMHVWNDGFCTPCNTPLAEAEIGDLDGYNWPKAEDYFCFDGLREKARYLYENTSYALVARMPCWGLFDIAHQLRGMQQLFIDMYEDPDFVHALVSKILDCELEIYGKFLDQVGPYVQMVETCDDMGSQSGPMFSAEIYRKFFKEPRTKLNSLIHSKAPGSKVFLHSCGAIANLIPDLIDSGVEVLNPVQPSVPGMDPAALKEQYGSSLVFHGCIDTQQAMRGNLQQVHDEVSSKISLLYRNGGYIVAPSNHILRDVPPENITQLYRTALNHFNRG